MPGGWNSRRKIGCGLHRHIWAGVATHSLEASRGRCPAACLSKGDFVRVLSVSALLRRSRTLKVTDGRGTHRIAGIDRFVVASEGLWITRYRASTRL
jgi:hypothetical protein